MQGKLENTAEAWAWVLKQFMAGEDGVVVLEDGMAEARWEL